MSVDLNPQPIIQLRNLHAFGIISLGARVDPRHEKKEAGGRSYFCRWRDQPGDGVGASFHSKNYSVLGRERQCRLLRPCVRSGQTLHSCILDDERRALLNGENHKEF